MKNRKALKSAVERLSGTQRSFTITASRLQRGVKNLPSGVQARPIQKAVMAKFKFPRNPNADRGNPFEDEQGDNPFGDEAPPAIDAESPATSEQNPYASAEPSEVQPYRPGDYELFLPHRGELIWWLGVIGCSVQLLAILVAALAIFSVGDFLSGLVYGLPGQLVGLAVSVPAWIMGHNDVRAIAAGAMKAEGRRATQWGLWLGILGTLLAAGQLVLYFGLIVFEEFFA